MRQMIWIGLLVFSVFSGCASHQERTRPDTRQQNDSVMTHQPEQSNAELDTVIQAYSGGGVAGTYSGCALSTGGTVREFTRNAMGIVLQETTATVPADSVRFLLNQLQATGIFNHPIRKTGNMTYYFSYKDPQQTFLISWVSPDDVPEKFWQWYTRFQQRCQQWLTATTNK